MPQWQFQNGGFETHYLLNPNMSGMSEIAEWATKKGDGGSPIRTAIFRLPKRVSETAVDVFF
ncbi:hypothetical protein RYX41_18415 [Lactiplantibacillus plantarum]|nr:hypothetical protein [Lactiplantibacillus plantarum]